VLRPWSFKTSVVALTVAAASAVSIRALACGASAGGIAGISGCSLDEHNEAVRKKWHVGVSGSYTSTAIRFEDDLRFDQQRNVVLATLDYAPKRDMTLELGLGSMVDGSFERAGAVYDFSPGLILLVGGSYHLLKNDGTRPFVLLGGQITYVLSSTQQYVGDESVAYNAFDLRVGAVVGWTFWHMLSPYALARLFGGPVFWEYQGEAISGGDVHHYQLGAGLSLVILERANIYVEGVPLGEQAIAGGAGFSF
jgi:hypothetical protein